MNMNTDRLQTVMGVGESTLIAIVTYLSTMTPDGVDYTSPLFWIGGLLAVSRGVKSYYAAGVQPQPKKETI